MSKNNMLKSLLALTSRDSVIVVHRHLVYFTGSLEAAMMLSQLMYWTERATLADGWIAKSDSEFKDELHLTRYSVRTAREKLEELMLVKTEKRMFSGRMTLHYQLNYQRLVDLWGDYINEKGHYAKTDSGIDHSPKTDMYLSENGQSITESTTETTINAENEKQKDTNYLDNVASILSGEHQEEYDAKVEARKSSTAKALQRGYSVAESYKAEISERFNINPNWDTKTARSFLKWLNALPEEQTIEKFAHWWYVVDWRGLNGQPPTLTQIRELWPSAFVSERMSPHNIATEVWE